MRKGGNLSCTLLCFSWEAEAQRSGACPDLGKAVPTCIVHLGHGDISGLLLAGSPALLSLKPGAVILAKTSWFCWAPSCLQHHLLQDDIFLRVFTWEMAPEFLLWVWYFLCFPGAMRFCLVKNQRGMGIKGLKPLRCLETRV